MLGVRFRTECVEDPADCTEMSRRANCQRSWAESMHTAECKRALWLCRNLSWYLRNAVIFWYMSVKESCWIGLSASEKETNNVAAAKLPELSLEWMPFSYGGVHCVMRTAHVRISVVGRGSRPEVSTTG